MMANTITSTALLTSEQWWGLLADTILLIHVAFVLFIMLGLLLVWTGAAFRWSMVRHRLFRHLHLGAMGFVLFETVIGMVCPLTEWEAALRERAGQETYGSDTFMQYWLQRILYWDLSAAGFIILYATVFSAMVLTYFLIPPYPKRART